MLLLAFAIVIALLTAALLRLRASMLEPTFVFLGAWSIIVAVAALAFVEYDKVLSFRAATSLIVCIALFVSGALIVRRKLRASRGLASIEERGHMQAPTLLTSLFLAVGSLTYLGIELLDVRAFLSAGGFDSITLADLREEHLEGAGDALSFTGVAQALSRAVAIITAAALPILIRTRRTSLALLGATDTLALFAESLLAGGRVVLAYVALSIVYFYLHSVQQRKVRHRFLSLRVAAVAVVILILSYGMLVIFPAARNPALVDNVDKFLANVHTAHVSGWVWSASEMPIFSALPVFAFASSYISQPLVKYTFFLETSDVTDWYLLGSYNFPIVAKVVSVWTAEPYSWTAIRGDLAILSEVYGFGENPWATGIRDLNIDFGIWGTFLAMFLFGAGSQWLYERTTRSEMMEWRVVLALAVPMVFFFAFFSPFPLGVFTNTVLVAAGWAIFVDKTLVSRSKTAPG